MVLPHFLDGLNFLKKLITDIRKQTDNEIIVQVNPFNKTVDDQYRKDLMIFCSFVDNLHLTTYPTFTSLSKMWNTIVLNASNKDVLILNDDITISNPTLFNDIENVKNAYSGLCIFNNSWSHFLISKQMLNDLNYFDERLLAYGEEDGDMVWRYIQKFKVYPPTVYLNGIANHGEGYGLIPPNLKWFDAGNVIRPLFNRDFCFNKKYSPNPTGHRGMFDTNRIDTLGNEKQYPYEKFKLDNVDNI